MKEKRYVVPEGMLKAAVLGLDAPRIDPEGYFINPALEAALRWFVETILDESNADFHREILKRGRERYPQYGGSYKDVGSYATQRVAFEFGVSFARHYIRDLFLSAKPDHSVKNEDRTKIVVPDGMYEAALKYQDSGIQCSAALEAALRWMIHELGKMKTGTNPTWDESVNRLCEMFLAHETMKCPVCGVDTRDPDIPTMHLSASGNLMRGHMPPNWKR